MIEEIDKSATQIMHNCNVTYRDALMMLLIEEISLIREAINDIPRL